MMNSSAPKVSICIPVRNGGGFFRLAVESALNQSFQDFEIVIVDNASTDGTIALAEEFAAGYDKVNLIKNAKNIGLVGNFNACLRHAKGEYIKFLCADDLLLSDCLEKMLQAIEGEQSVVLVAGGRKIINESGELMAAHKYARARAAINGHEVINRCLFGGNYIGEPSAVMFRRDIASRGFREDLPHLMDMEMWFHLLERGKMVNLPDPLCAIRRHGRQMTIQSIQSGALVEDNVRVFEQYGKKPYIGSSLIGRLQRRVRMAYRIWLCRGSLEPVRLSELLERHSSRLVYYVVMPILARVLSGIRHAHLMRR